MLSPERGYLSHVTARVQSPSTHARTNAQVEELRVAVYQLNWYTFTRTEQRMINLLMERTARPTGFRALNYIDCNNVTFAQVSTADVVVNLGPPARLLGKGW